jgi:ABC-type multidrug transport system ATPase subunit
MTDLLVSAQGVSYRYPKSEAVAISNCSLEVRRGEVAALIGHNGAGKSTLFDIIGGLHRPTAGAVTVSALPGEIGWCPQREIVDWSLTIRQNIELGLQLRERRPKSVRRGLVEQTAEAYGLTAFLDRTAETVSGGELRRTQIGRAVVGSPSLLLLDEPTTGLDPSGISIVFNDLRSRAESGAAALISTHETSRFASYCSRVVAMYRGRILVDESTEDFLLRTEENDDDLWSRYLAILPKENE